ncbi:MAG: hypothetical protein A2Y17_06260 [Clostridiales bacterium GWF2_38_85]|nr:MAG: hypothetical protein A2Y17_06260 [Clostridiales bacterium GWF2_38_85]HBL85495.1 hypothetical protein [Clostridiales bacterium]
MKHDDSLGLLIKESLKSLDNIKPDESLKAKTLERIAKYNLTQTTAKRSRLNYKRISSVAAMFILMCITFSILCPKYTPQKEFNHYNDNLSTCSQSCGNNTAYYDHSYNKSPNLIDDFVEFFNYSGKALMTDKEKKSTVSYSYYNSFNSNIISCLEDGISNENVGESIVIDESNKYIGEWNDNKNWVSSCSLKSLSALSSSIDSSGSSTVIKLPTDGVFGMTLTDRIKISVISNGIPVNRATVIGYNEKDCAVYKAVSDNNGRAYLFNNVFDKSADNKIKYIEVSKNDVTETINAGADIIDVDLSGTAVEADEKILDLMFIINTKSSMKDEFETIKNSISDIIQNIRSQNPGIKVRLSINFYRDKSELYLTRPFKFFENTDIAINIMKSQSCLGSGDYEEALDYALVNAVYEHSWSDNAYAKLLFVMNDSPPRQTVEANARIIDAVKTATEQGIRIIPVTSSGTDTVTEFLARSLATATGGTYTFFYKNAGDIKYDVKNTVGNFKLYEFTEGITKIINEYLQ